MVTESIVTTRNGVDGLIGKKRCYQLFVAGGLEYAFVRAVRIVERFFGGFSSGPAESLGKRGGFDIKRS